MKDSAPAEKDISGFLPLAARRTQKKQPGGLWLSLGKKRGKSFKVTTVNHAGILGKLFSGG